MTRSEREAVFAPLAAIALALTLFGGYKLAVWVTAADAGPGEYTTTVSMRDKGYTRVVTVENVVTAAPKTVRVLEHRRIPDRAGTTRVVTLTKAVTVPRRVTVGGQTRLVTVPGRRLTVTEVRRVPDRARTVTDRRFVTVTVAAGRLPAARTVTVQRRGTTVTHQLTVTNRQTLTAAAQPPETRIVATTVPARTPPGLTRTLTATVSVTTPPPRSAVSRTVTESVTTTATVATTVTVTTALTTTVVQTVTVPKGRGG